MVRPRPAPSWPPRTAPPRLLARSGRRWGGLLRPAGSATGGGLRLRVAADPVDGRAGVLPRPAPSGTGVVQNTVLLLHSGHYSLIRNFQALAGRQGLTLGATHPTPAAARSTSARGAWPASPRRPRGSATAPPSAIKRWPSALEKRRCPGPRRACRYRGKDSAELAPLTCYTDLKVYSTPAPTVHIAQQQPAPDRRGFFLLHRGRPLRLHAARGAEAEAHAPRALPYLETPNSARQHDPAEELEHRAATYCRECLASFESREEAPPLPQQRAVSQGAVPLLQQRPRRPRPSPWSFTTWAATSTSCCATSPRWALLSAGHRAKSSARTATRHQERGRRKRAREAHAHGQGCAKGQGQGRAKAPHRQARPAAPPSPLQVGQEVPADSWGPLRFVDSMNERLPHEPGQHDRRPQGLHAQAAAELFPLMASLHPELRTGSRLKDGLSSSGGRPSASTTTLPPHRRLGPGGRDGELPARLPFTLSPTSRPTRASVMGGLSCIFQPFAQANNPELGKEDSTPRSPSAASRTWTSTPCTRPQ